MSYIVVPSTNKEPIASIRTSPIKVNYNVGEVFDITGLSLNVTYPNGTSKIISYFNVESEFLTPLKSIDTYQRLYIADGKYTIKIDIPISVGPQSLDYLCFEAAETNSSVTCPKAFEYSTDKINWLTASTTTPIILNNIGDKIYVRNGSVGTPTSALGTFAMTGKIKASGNVMSLVDNTCQSLTIPCNECFKALFKRCWITQAPKLPAINLTDNCYESMFGLCTQLTIPPELPATTLTKSCYHEMFFQCIKLKKTPYLPATTLAEGCYWCMFGVCLELIEVMSILPATTLAKDCYTGMFLQCELLSTWPTLPATTLAKDCYSGMFSHTAIINTPELPATTLAEGCYSLMFSGCTSLTTAPELPATTLAEGCYFNMFNGCTSLEIAPILLSTTLTDSCYQGMFWDCSNLNKITINFTQWDESLVDTYNWVNNVSSEGTFICPRTLPIVCDESHIPIGWTIEYIDDTPLKIGICQLVQHSALDAACERFCEYLRDTLGSTNVDINLVNVSGEVALCDRAINDLINWGSKLIFNIATPPLQHAANITTTLPLLGSAITNYPAALNIPISEWTGVTNRNISGTSDVLNPNCFISILTDWFPTIDKVALFYCGGETTLSYICKDFIKILEEKGINYQTFEFNNSMDISSILNQACDYSNIVLSPVDNVIYANNELIKSVIDGRGAIFISQDFELCNTCSLAGAPVDYYSLGELTARMAIKILIDGEDIKTMPIEYLTPDSRYYNSSICTARGLTPPSGYIAI